MKKPVLTIFYQFDPWKSSIGGIQTTILNFIKYAPDDFLVRLVGITSDLEKPVGQWSHTEIAGRKLLFLPLFMLPNDDVRGLVPTSVRYTAALLGKSYSSDFMHFHRIEPSLATSKWKGDKTLFVHFDIKSQMKGSGTKNSILWRYFPSLYFALEGYLVNQFSQILSCNSDAVELYKNNYPRLAENVSLVRNTVDSEVFYPYSPSELHLKRQELCLSLGLSQQTRFLLFAGRLHPQKDPMLLLKSFAELSEPNIHLLMVGEGELSNKVEAEIENLNLCDRVTMLGALKQSDLADLHRISSALVMTSVYEGLPIVVLEALACGTPVVTTCCGETPNLLTENTGVVCNERTASNISQSMRQILSNPETFPSEACLQIAQPFFAKTVVRELFDDMRQRWHERSDRAAVVGASVH